MKQQRISHERLKLIACATMLLDHIGAAVLPGIGLRIIGRIAFPIYCFLLAEGVSFTKNPGKYGLRLAVCALLSEIPFDLLLFGELTWTHQNAMLTLLLGFLMAQCVHRTTSPALGALLILLFSLAAEWLNADYGGLGIILIGLFLLTREMSGKLMLQALGMGIICWCMGGRLLRIGEIGIPIQVFSVFSMIPIAFYSGQKSSQSKTLQWAFYLFYPAHLAILLWVT